MTKKISDFITEDVKTVAVAGHLRPDGDCIGSVTAVSRYLKDLFPALEVRTFLQDAQEELDFLKEGLQTDGTDGDGTVFDLCILTDVSDASRIGAGKNAFANARHTVVIDHHLSNAGFGDENYVFPEASSACEVLCGMMDMEKVSYGTAVSLFTGLVHDTGVFRYSCTGPQTLAYASVLIAKGIPFTEIIEDSFVSKPRELMLFTAEVDLHSCFFEEERVLVGAASLELQDAYGVSYMEIGGVPAHLNETKEAEVTVFFYELNEGEWKASVRSHGNVNAASLAARFGGGGHARAAGFEWNGDVQDGVDAVLKAVREARDE
ncbi:MAG: DHH family phosphoesterase [Lachnospiraceae bacterium]|nr:DHH family phosphoesterase [Lachnospiraceae bacterium]